MGMTPSVAEVLERQRIAAIHFAHINMDPDVTGELTRLPATSLAQIGRIVAESVPFWWTMEMLDTVMASPLPPDYVTPPLPYDSVWWGFPGADDDAWSSVVMSVRLSGIVAMVKHDFFAARYGPGWSEQRMVDAMRVFLDSEYVTTERKRQGGSRAARRKVGDTAVHFVVLRRPTSHGASATPHTVDWSHRWLVRGHFRNQYYPSTGTHRTIWVASYVKGPADAPFSVPVYKVAR